MIDSNKPTILLIDDKPKNLFAVEKVLAKPDLTILKALSGNEGLSMMLENEVALVLLDVQMPDMDGFEVARLMQLNEDTRHIPIIFMTAISKERQHIFKGYAKGAVDYMFKPLDPSILRSKVTVFINLYHQKKHLERINMELTEVNKKLIDQQRSLIEEERLKTLFQMAGATAHELNQPLMGLLGSIELMEIYGSDPLKLAKYMKRVKAEGDRITEIIRKIQNIRFDHVKLYENINSRDKYIIDIDQQPTRLLLIDDDPNWALSFQKLIDDQKRYPVSVVSSFEAASDWIKKEGVDLILSEYLIDDDIVFDFLKRMSVNRIHIPLVILTDKKEGLYLTRAMQVGAYDVVAKATLGEEKLKKLIDDSLEKSKLKIELNDARLKLAKLVTTDHLTGLHNRNYFQQSLKAEVERATRYKTPLSLCMIRLEDFSKINETFGNSVGDMVLTKVGRRILESIRQNDICCRFSGSQFAILLPHTRSDRARLVLDRIKKSLMAETVEYESLPIPLKFLTGLGVFDEKRHMSESLLVHLAELDLNAAKASSDSE